MRKESERETSYATATHDVKWQPRKDRNHVAWFSCFVLPSKFLNKNTDESSKDLFEPYSTFIDHSEIVFALGCKKLTETKGLLVIVR